MSSPVPILFSVRELNQGGIERDVSRVAAHLDRTRFTPHVATFNAEGMRYRDLVDAGIPVLHLPVQGMVSAAAAREAWRLWRYVRRHGIRLVHAWDITGVLTIPVARLAGIPVLSSVLGDRVWLDDRSRQLWRMSDRWVSRFVVNCEAMGRHLREDEKIDGTPIELCYNGVDTRQFFPPSPDRRLTGDGPLVIGAICALRPEKALHLLQEAFAQVRGLSPGCRLLIVGSGVELARLQANAERLGITGESTFVPATPRVAEYLASIDIFVLCSSSEAFSNALLEAMACGCCPVGSQVGGTPEMLGSDGRSGLLFRNQDAGDLAAQLALLIRDPARRRQIAQNAAARAREKFSAEINVARTQEIYASVLA